MPRTSTTRSSKKTMPTPFQVCTVLCCGRIFCVIRVTPLPLSPLSLELSWPGLGCTLPTVELTSCSIHCGHRVLILRTELSDLCPLRFSGQRTAWGWCWRKKGLWITRRMYSRESEKSLRRLLEMCGSIWRTCTSPKTSTTR